MRDSESNFLREEALRAEVASLKKARRSLESKLLDRDGESMEVSRAKRSEAG